MLSWKRQSKRQSDLDNCVLRQILNWRLLSGKQSDWVQPRLRQAQNGRLSKILHRRTQNLHPSHL